MEDAALHDFIKGIEKDLLFYIILHLREEKITMGNVKNLAHAFLAIFPVVDRNELLRKMDILGDTYKEARDVYAKYLNLYEEEKRETLLALMRMHMHQGEFEKAVAVAKGGI